MTRDFICLSCPIGCRLHAETDASGAVAISGNKCPRGKVYGETEMIDPRRIVTAVVRTDSDAVPYVPVRTDVPLPRGLAPKLLNEIYALRVALPVKRGDVLIANFADTGVNVVFSCDAG